MTSPCLQADRITKLETTLDLTNKNVMDKIDRIDDKVDALTEKLDWLLEKLEDKFVLRTEFKVWIGVLSALWLIMSLIAYLAK